MKYIVIGVVTAVILYTLTLSDKQEQKQVVVNGVSYKVINANTEELRKKGLSGRQGLEDDTIMLFSFGEPGLYGFWMKDMLFPIDILWTDEKGEKVLYIERRVTPDTYPKAFYPPQNSLYVLESAAGVFDGVKVGDLVEIK